MEAQEAKDLNTGRDSNGMTKHEATNHDENSSGYIKIENGSYNWGFRITAKREGKNFQDLNI